MFPIFKFVEIIIGKGDSHQSSPVAIIFGARSGVTAFAVENSHECF